MGLKICFAGLGSIGTRHLRNLTQILNERNIQYELHALRSSNRKLAPEVASLINREIDSLQTPNQDYDIAVIATPTAQHYDSISFFLPRAHHLFIEKPLFERCDRDFPKPDLHRDRIFYVAAPLRYTAVFDALQEFVSKHRVYCARAICSSYLPDWRKDADYRKIYSAVAELGGGVPLDLIHEWDYLCALFGYPFRVQWVHGRYSDLEINSSDLAAYIGIYADKLVELHLDYFGKTPQRNIQVFSENCVYTADFLRNQVTRSEAGTEQTISLPTGDLYMREMNCFLDLCFGLRKDNPNPLDQAYKTLKVALGDRP